MNVLGVFGATDVIHPAAALFRDGRLVAFAEEERFARVKQASGLFRRCPACDSGDFADDRVVVGVATHTCRSCGLVLSSTARCRPKLGQYENVDLAAYLASAGAVRDEQSAQILSLVRAHLAPGGRVLDVGCGFGSFLRRAQAAGFAVAGIEPDAAACAGACEALGGPFVRRGTLLDVQPPRASADLVATLDVLDHVPPADHATFAGAVSQALSPGGLWVLKVPTTEGLYYRASAMLARVAPRWGAVYMRRLWQTDYEFPHTVYFSRRSLETWLRRHGFAVVASRYLPEVPLATVIQRLTHDGEISRARAWLLAPAVLILNTIEYLRRRSDALVVLARRT